MEFKKATKKAAKLRMALVGPPGSGKTYTALEIGSVLGSRVAVIDTEHGSASKYADRFNFDVLELASYSPLTYVEAIQAAVKAGYDVVIVDSLSHAWTGKDGALEQVDRIASRNKGGNSFTAWRDVTPQHNQMIEAIIAAKAHVITTMRVKTDYVMEEYTDSSGKKRTRPVKVGLAPIQREGMEYEMDIVGDMDQENNLVITKSRCPDLSGKMIPKPGKALVEVIKLWLTGEPEPIPETNGSKPNGQEFQRRIYDFDAKLVKQGTCAQGELVTYLVQAGVVEGYPADLGQWDAKGFQFATDVVQTFINTKKKVSA